MSLIPTKELTQQREHEVWQLRVRCYSQAQSPQNSASPRRSLPDPQARPRPPGKRVRAGSHQHAPRTDRTAHGHRPRSPRRLGSKQTAGPPAPREEIRNPPPCHSRSRQQSRRPCRSRKNPLNPPKRLHLRNNPANPPTCAPPSSPSPPSVPSGTWTRSRLPKPEESVDNYKIILWYRLRPPLHPEASTSRARNSLQDTEEDDRKHLIFRVARPRLWRAALPQTGLFNDSAPAGIPERESKPRKYKP